MLVIAIDWYNQLGLGFEVAFGEDTLHTLAVLLADLGDVEAVDYADLGTI